MPGYQRIAEVPWVLFAPRGAGFHVVCEACRAQTVGGGGELQAFARAHNAHRSQVATHYGLGDAIAAMTSRLGINHCGECEGRRYQLNQLVPRFVRR